MTPEELAEIRSLVGEVSAEQLRYVDCFVGGGIGLFIPTVGPCFYAVSPDHAHPGYSFILVSDDYSRLVVRGERIATPPGQIVAIDPGAVHHEAKADEPPRYLAILIDRELFDRQLADYAPLTPTPFDFRTFPPGRELSGLCKEFMSEAETRQPGRATLLAAIALRIVHSLIRAACNLAPLAAGSAHRVEIHRALQYLHAHAGDRLSVEQLAGIAAMSPSHFSRVFRRETGKTPLAYLQRVRLEQARKRLRAGDGSIATVALACGFATPSHFCTAFRRAYGQSPSTFLKALG